MAIFSISTAIGEGNIALSPFGNRIMKKITVVAVVLLVLPTVAMAAPSVGIGYTGVGLSGHNTRPGITLTAGNRYSNDVVASGSATFARSYYQMQTRVAKLIPAGGVSFEPYLSVGFINMNYHQQETGYTTQTVNSGYGFAYTQTTPHSYLKNQSIQDFFGLAGVNLNVPIGSNVALQFGGGYGHTFSVFNGAGGSVYTGEATVALQIAQNVIADLQVNYLHMPGNNLTSYGAGISYLF